MPAAHFLRVRFAAVVAAALVASAGLPAPALAVVPIPTTLTLAVSPDPPALGDAITITATLTPDSSDGTTPYGTLTFFEVVAGVPTPRGLTNLNGSSTSMTWTSGIYGIGSHEVYAVWTSSTGSYASSQSASLFFDVGKALTETRIFAVPEQPTFEAHNAFQVRAFMHSLVADSTGTVSFYRVGVATPICADLPIATDNEVFCTVPALPIGTYQFIARYAGTSKLLASDSDPITLGIVADTVHASGVGVATATIYPVKDGYYDTDAIRGTRDEPISVGIKIYNGSNVLVRSATIGIGSGAYSYAWNGRNSAGTVLAEGKYRVVQTLKDAYNTTKVVTSYITLSKKYLHWHATSITKAGSSVSSSGAGGGGTIAVSTTGGYIRLRAPLLYTDWAGAGWQFVLPTAISYRSIAFRIYAKHAYVAGGYTRIGAQNFSTCAYSATGDWYESCFDSWHDIGNAYGTLAWYSTGTLTAAHRYVHVVRGSISESGGQTYVYKAQVTFSYSTLGY